MKRILLVDDDDLFLNVMEKLLVKEGYEVSAALNGLEALSLAKAGSFDLIVMDVRMPVMDGIEALSEMKRSQPTLKSITITGYTTLDSERRAHKIGTSAFFYKPLEIDKFLQAIKQTLATVEGDSVREERTRCLECRYLKVITSHITALLSKDEKLLNKFLHRRRILSALIDHFHLSSQEGQILELAGCLMDLSLHEEEPPLNSIFKVQFLEIKNSLEENQLMEPVMAILSSSKALLNSTKNLVKKEVPFLSRLLATANMYAEKAVEKQCSYAEFLLEMDEYTKERCDPCILEALKLIGETASTDLMKNGLFASPTQNSNRELRNRIHSLIALGNLYLENNNHSVALEAYGEGLNLLDLLPNDRSSVLCYFGMARCYLGLKKKKTAIQVARFVLDICKQNKFNQLLFDTLLFLCKYFLEEEDSNQANGFLEEASLLLAAGSDRGNLVRFQLYLTRLELVKNEPQAAFEKWQMAINYLQQMTTPYLLLEEKESFSLLASAFVDATSLTKDLLKTAKKLEEREIEFIGCLLQKIPEKKRSLFLQLMKEEFQVPTSARIIRVFSFGSIRVYRSGELIMEKEWRFKKTRTFLLLLLAHDPKKLTDDFIIDLLWPNTPFEKAKNNLYHAVHHLRKILEPSREDPSRSLYILREGNCYYFNKNAQYWWDVDEFEKIIKSSEEFVQRGDIENAINSFQDMKSLYQGDFLQENLEDEWVLLFRQQLQQKFLSAQIKLLRCYVSIDNWEGAIECARQVLEEDPYNEEIYLIAMQGYIKTENHANAIKHYKNYMKIMYEELKLSPSKEIEELYQKALRRER